MNTSKTPLHISAHRSQSGAALMVMLVIMIIGTAVFLVTSLSKVTLNNERNKTASDMLARAKEVVIGYAVNGTGGGQRPGALPNPDRLVPQPEEPATTDGHPNYNGLQDDCPGSNACLGRLPWRTLGLSIESPSENDPLGFMPWYAASGNLFDVFVPINSELLNTDNILHAPNNYPAPPHPWLTVRDMNGNVLSDRVAFILIIPGRPLPGQTRPAASISPPVSLGDASQYLDSITVGGTTYKNFDGDNDFIMGDEHRWINDPANPGKQIEDATYQFNDKLLYVTIDELMPLIEKRIAREAKNCLDSYAALSNGKYPWAAPVSDTASYASSNNTRFGRFPTYPNVFNTDQNVLDLLDAIAKVRTALNNYIANNTSSTRSALSNAGSQLENLGETPQSPITTTIGNAAKNAGDNAKDLAKTPPQSTVSDVQTALSNTISQLASAGFISSDTSMNTVWPTSCTLFTKDYWGEWKNLVFYQLADGYKPGTPTPACGTSCLSISGNGNPTSGSGSYRAIITVAGKMIGAQTRSSNANKQDRTNYLEGGINPTNKTNIPSGTNALNYETYRVSDIMYQTTTNDLAICLDGKDLNPGSLCQ